jgi:hypothetical protein
MRAVSTGLRKKRVNIWDRWSVWESGVFGEDTGWERSLIREEDSVCD